MGSVTLYANRSAQIKFTSPSTNFSSDTAAEVDSGAPLLLGFPALSAGLEYRELTSAVLRVYVGALSYGAVTLRARELLTAFDEAAVTFNSYEGNIGYGSAYFDIAANANAYTQTVLTGSRIFGLLERGVGIDTAGNRGVVDTSRGSNKPYVVITYSDEDVTGTLESLTPQSGFVAKYAAKRFSWRVGKSGACFGSITQTAATFRWRTAEGATPVTVSCGANSYCDVPANTFTTASVQWSVVVTTNTGETLTSDWFTVSTVEATSTALCVAPVSAIVDGADACEFTWQHVISTGTAQTAAELQKSADGSVWETLESVSGAAQSVTVAANSLSAAVKYWRVRTFNTDSAPGAWSDAAEIMVIAAPAAPVVSAEASPRPLISWQSEGQLAYEVSCGDYSGGERFGVERSLRLPYLADGDYTARVRVQNQYGLWSPWGSAAFTVANSPGSAITLSGSAGRGAVLSWTDGGGYDAYIIYRDGEAIARVGSRTYADNGAIGTHSYTVRGVSDGSCNYGLSAALSLTVAPETLCICDAESGAWLDLPHSESQTRALRVSRSATVSYAHYLGSAYPAAERSDFRDSYLSFDCAFRLGSALAVSFEALLGREVIVKTPAGAAVRGILDAVPRTENEFTLAYAVTVRQIAEEVMEL